MTSIALTVGTAIVAFITTNVDEILLLMLFFAQTNASFRKRHIVAEHYLGFFVIIAISLLGFAGALILPRSVVGLLGIVPILLGLYQLFRISPDTDDDVPTSGTATAHGLLTSILSAQTASVAAVTIANGADNISVYVPLFANHSLPDVAVMIFIFALLIGVWCYAGYRLVRYPLLARFLERYGERLVPYVFIVLGIFILLEGTFGT